MMVQEVAGFTKEALVLWFGAAVRPPKVGLITVLYPFVTEMSLANHQGMQDGSGGNPDFGDECPN